MSIQAISYVLQESPMKKWDRLVEISLANHANDRLESWPAVQTMAHEAGIHERTVQRSLRHLEDSGEILAIGEHSRGGRRATTYFLSGFHRWLVNVGQTTVDIPRKTLAKPTVSLRKRHDKGQKTPNTPAASHPTPGGTATPGVAIPPPQPRPYGHPSPGGAATPVGPASHPSPGSQTPQGWPHGHPNRHRTVIEPGAKHPAPSARPESGRTDALKGGRNHDRPPDTAWREGLDQPADPATLKEIAEHMRAVAEGKAMPTLVGPDYHEEENDESESKS